MWRGREGIGFYVAFNRSYHEEIETWDWEDSPVSYTNSFKCKSTIKYHKEYHRVERKFHTLLRIVPRDLPVVEAP